jgi:hypothetical protein
MKASVSRSEITAMQVSPDALATDIRALETDRIARVHGLAAFEQEQRRSGACEK